MRNIHAPSDKQKKKIIEVKQHLIYYYKKNLFFKLISLLLLFFISHFVIYPNGENCLMRVTSDLHALSLQNSVPLYLSN